MQLLDGNKIAATIKQEVICAVKNCEKNTVSFPALPLLLSVKIRHPEFMLDASIKPVKRLEYIRKL